MIIGELAVVLAAKTQQFVKDFGASEKSIVALGNSATSVGTKLSAGVTLPLLAAGTAGVAFAEDMNKGMANVATLIPGNTARLEELKDTVQDVQVATGKMTSELTDGMFQVISAFGEGADTQKQFELTARAAVAGQTDLTGALNLGSAVTKAYGDTSQEALGKVFDLAFKTNELGQTTFPELAASIGRVTPLANELGISQENLFATMATLTGVTGNTSEVSTQFAAILRSLLAPTDAMTDLLGSMGIASGKAALEQFGLQGTLNLVKEAADSTGIPLQEFLGRAEGMVATLALTDSQAQKFQNNLQAMGEASGSVNKAFAEQTDGINKVGFMMSQVSAKATVLAQDFGDALAPAVIFLIDKAAMPLLDVLSGAVDWFTSLGPAVQGVIIVFGGLATAAGPLLMVIGKISLLMPAIKSGFALIATGAAAISAPVLIATTAIVGMVTAWVMFKDEIIQFGGAVIDGYLIPALNSAIDAVNVWIAGFNSISSSLGGPVLDSMQRINETGKSLGSQFVDDIHAMDDAVMGWIGGMDEAPATIEQVGSFHSSVIKTATSEMVKFGTVGKASIGGVAGEWNSMSAIEIPKAIDNMQIVGKMHRDMAGNLVEDAKVSGTTWEQAMGRAVTAVGMMPKLAIPEAIDSMELAGEHAVATGGTISTAFHNAFDAIVSGTGSATDAFGSFIESSIRGVGNLIAKTLGIGDAFSSIFGGGGGGGGGGIGSLLSLGVAGGGAALGNMILPGIGGKLGGFLGGKVGGLFGSLFDDGGIVTQPTIGMFGKRGVPEAVIPLHRAGEFGFGGGAARMLTVLLEMDGDVVASKTVDLIADRGIA